MQKTTYFKIRITPSEEKQLKDDAKAAGCNLTQYIRRKVGLEVAPPATIKLEGVKAAQAARKPGTSLCVRCERVGVPSCPSCLKAAIG